MDLHRAFQEVHGHLGVANVARLLSELQSFECLIVVEIVPLSDDLSTLDRVDVRHANLGLDAARRPIRSSARIALTRQLSDARSGAAPSADLNDALLTRAYTTPRAAQAWARSTNGAAGSASRQRSRSCACRLASRAAV